MANGAVQPPRPPAERTPRSAQRAVLTYNLWRAVLFGVCLGLGWIAGLRSIALVLAALLVSGVLSWFVLRPQREAMGRAVERTVERSRERIAERAGKEDAYVEAHLDAEGNLSAEPPAAP